MKRVVSEIMVGGGWRKNDEALKREYTAEEKKIALVRKVYGNGISVVTSSGVNEGDSVGDGTVLF